VGDASSSSSSSSSSSANTGSSTGLSSEPGSASREAALPVAQKVRQLAKQFYVLEMAGLEDELKKQMDEQWNLEYSKNKKKQSGNQCHTAE
jgi:hypothetical protein